MHPFLLTEQLNAHPPQDLNGSTMVLVETTGAVPVVPLQFNLPQSVTASSNLMVREIALQNVTTR